MGKIEIEPLVRPNIKKLVAYSSARSEFTGQNAVFLDANENPFGAYNRYPDPLQTELKKVITARKNVPAENIFIGNGSDEAIDLLFRIFCVPGVDKALSFSPTYGMYEVAAHINDTELVYVPLDNNFQIDLSETAKTLAKIEPKLVFVCNPNNPTGNLMDEKSIVWLLENSGAIVIVDEAYIDFTNAQSFNAKVNEYANLIVLQTFSKAWGIASARVGMAFASREIITYFNKVKPPYNVSAANQKIALETLKNEIVFERQLAEIISERNRLMGELSALPVVQKIYPTDANFILVEVTDADKMYAQLVDAKLIVRNRNKVVKNCLRITVGTKDENDLLIERLQEISGIEKTAKKSEKLRTATVSRKTSETDILIELNLDGSGKSEITTGLGFFDHMLTQIARHGQIDMLVRVSGDLYIDEHHTIEDTALALGEAFSQALGDKRGIERYGFLLPMDDCLAQVAIDFGGRPWLVWNAEFKREKVGEVPTELFYHFFKSFSDTAKVNLNIKAEGENEHHKIESIFKAFAKAVKMAVAKGASNEIPSTKGTL